MDLFSLIDEVIRETICHLSWKQGIKLATIKSDVGSQSALIANITLEMIYTRKIFINSFNYRRERHGLPVHVKEEEVRQVGRR